MTKNPGKIISFEEAIAKPYIPLCQRLKGCDWPCPDVCGEVCIYWCTDDCKEKK
jgi:hypothetical protein